MPKIKSKSSFVKVSGASIAILINCESGASEREFLSLALISFIMKKFLSTDAIDTAWFYQTNGSYLARGNRKFCFNISIYSSSSKKL